MPSSPTKKKSSKKDADKQQYVPNILEAEYTKHMIECKCIHPLLKDLDPPVFHKFVVFSEMDPSTCDVKPSYAQCNNCGMVHKVVGIGTSQSLRKEDSSLVPSIDEIKFQLPTHIKATLEKYDCPLHVWQEAKFIFDNKLWGRFVILSKEKDSQESTVLHGKYMIIVSQALMKIETFEQDEGYINI